MRILNHLRTKMRGRRARRVMFNGLWFIARKSFGPIVNFVVHLDYGEMCLTMLETLGDLI